MVPSERTVTIGVGHGKKAARHIDAWLRGSALDAHAEAPDSRRFDMLHLWYFGDAARRQQPELEPSERSGGLRRGRRRPVGAGGDLRGAAGACRAATASSATAASERCPEDAVIKLGPGHRYRFDYDRCTGCARVLRAVPRARDRDVPGADADARDRSTATRPRPRSPTAATRSAASTRSRRPRRWPSWPTSGRAAGGPTSGARVPTVVEMQSEGGAAGALHGALQGGALATTFTASQGLLLMIPNMYKIAGELTSAVLHVAARSLAAQGLSIFGDHSDVMAVRQTGFALLAVRIGPGGARPGARGAGGDASDAGAVRALLRRLPHLARAEHDRAALRRRPARARPRGARPRAPRRGRSRRSGRSSAAPRRTPTSTSRRARPSTRSTPACPDVVAGRDGPARRAHGPPLPARRLQRAPRGRARAGRDGLGRGDGRARRWPALQARGERVGVAQVRLYRPFPAQALVQALPATVRRVAVLDRTKEPGSLGEPLFLDVLAALSEAHADGERELMPSVIGGRYGLSSKEFTPGMVAGVFDELGRERPQAAVHDRDQRRRLRHEPRLRRVA